MPDGRGRQRARTPSVNHPPSTCNGVQVVMILFDVGLKQSTLREIVQRLLDDETRAEDSLLRSRALDPALHARTRQTSQRTDPLVQALGHNDV